MVCDCIDLFITMSLPAGLELHQNVLSPEEQLKMVQTIEEWVVQVSCLHKLLHPVKAMLLHDHADRPPLPLCCKRECETTCCMCLQLLQLAFVTAHTT